MNYILGALGYILLCLVVARFAGTNGKRAQEDPVTGVSPLNYQPQRKEMPTVDMSDPDWKNQLEDLL